jgi:hypothetical protein
MVYSDTSTKLGILQECERKCNLGDTGITGTASVLATFTAYCNEASRQVWHWIFTSCGGWQYDDSNQTDLPAATATLTDSQNTYALPSTALTVQSISIKNESGDWYDLKPLTEEIIRSTGNSVEEFFETDGAPLYYTLVGNTIRLFPASNYTQADSLRVCFERGSVAFASTDTTKTPGFASEYHGVIPLLASIMWLKVKTPQDATLQMFRADAMEFEQRIKEFYSKRFKDMSPLVLRAKLTSFK